MALLPSGPVKFKGILFACAIGLIAFAVSTVYSRHGLLSLYAMRADYEQLERSVTQLQQDNHRAQERIHQLESDDRYIEKVARERLGLVKPGEVIYRLDAAAAPAAPAPHK